MNATAALKSHNDLESPAKHKAPISPTSEGTPGSPPVLRSSTGSPIRNQRSIHQREYTPYTRPDYKSYHHSVGAIQLGSTVGLRPDFVQEVKCFEPMDSNMN